MSGPTEPLWRLVAGLAALTAAVLLGALLACQAEGGLDDTNWVGTLGEWFGALGTLFAVGATILMARQASRESDKRHAVEQAALREELRIAEDQVGWQRRREAEADLSKALHRAENLLLDWSPTWSRHGPVGRHEPSDRLDGAQLDRLENTGTTPFYRVEFRLLLQRPERWIEWGPPYGLGTMLPGQSLPGRNADERRGIGMMMNDLVTGATSDDRAGNQEQAIAANIGLTVTYAELHHLPIDVAVDYTDSMGHRWRRRRDSPVELLAASQGAP